MVSRIVLFSGVPERCKNFSRPAFLLMSLNTTVAPSTNPPAVIGRESESLTAGCAPPVATPIPEEDCFAGGFAGCWPVEPSAIKKIENTANSRLDAKSSFGRCALLIFGLGEVTPESYLDSLSESCFEVALKRILKQIS